MAVFEIYFDESYESDLAKPGFFTVAGCLADKRAWRKFTATWQSHLGRLERKCKKPLPYLHMREFLHRKDLNPAEKAEVMADLVSVVNARLEHCFAASVALPDYNEILVKPMGWTAEDVWFHPYNYCLQANMQGIMRQFGLKRRGHDRIACVFERHDQLNYRIESHFWEIVDYYRWRDVFVSRASGSRQEYIPLQAADVLAYEVQASLRPDHPIRKSFRRLITKPRRVLSKIAYRNEIKAVAADLKASGVGAQKEWREEVKRRRRARGQE